MSTTELYVAFLKDIRYNDMNVRDNFSLSDFEPGSKGYELMNLFNTVALKLTTICEMMQQVVNLTKGCDK